MLFFKAWVLEKAENVSITDDWMNNGTAQTRQVWFTTEKLTGWVKVNHEA
jgi:hypothetical protein